jgi:serine/threonine-protein kinase
MNEKTILHRNEQLLPHSNKHETKFGNYSTSTDLHTAETLEMDVPTSPHTQQTSAKAETALTRSLEEHETAIRDQLVFDNSATQLNTALTQLLDDPVADALSQQPPKVDRNKYEYLGEIARGGMGRIVSVQDRFLRRKVAMKLLITSNGRATSQQVGRLLAEAQTTGQLEHPNIVPIHDVGVQQDNNYYFTMKLVKGTTLREIFRKLNADSNTSEQYSLARLLAIFQQIANGLGFAHSRGVIHRDLKPDNIMIGEFGEVLIMDWGIAKQVPQSSAAPTSDQKSHDYYSQSDFKGIDTTERERTVLGTVAGTAGYMSPEQARGEIDRLDARTDIFSLGAMLYELLAGSPPYNQSTMTERLRATSNEAAIDKPSIRRLKTTSSRGRSIPREVSAIAMKAIALKPGNRYQAAQEFVEDVQRYLEGRSVTACPDTVAQRATKWTKRNRVAVGTVLGLILAVVFAGWSARALTRRTVISQNRDEARRIVSAAQTEREQRIQSLTQAKVNDDGYAELNKQRDLDSIDEKYTAQLTEAANYYARIFDYDPLNLDARSELAKVYMEMWRAAQRRNKAELMSAYAQEVARFAGTGNYDRQFQAEINGDGKLKLLTGNVKADVFIFRNMETGKWNRLTPVPYRLAERRVDNDALAEATSRLRQSVDGHDGSSVFFFNLDERFGHHVGQTPISIEQMPAGSYVFVLRAPGYDDLHLPVTLARQKNLDLNVRILRPGERPPGFSYVPSVLAKVGGPAAGTQGGNFTWKPVKAFFIQTYEVTFGEYEQFLLDLIANGRVQEARQHLPRDFGFYYLEIAGAGLKPHSSLTDGWRKWAVRGVSWLDAAVYADWRSRKDGVAYRLPTELEWEVAARGTDGRKFTWGEVFWPQGARLSQGYTSANNTRKTGQFADESVFGVWDMTGGQAEWCADEFSGRSGERVLKGNAWALQPAGLETAFRTSGPPDYFHSTTGFRLATDVK